MPFRPIEEEQPKTSSFRPIEETYIDETPIDTIKKNQPTYEEYQSKPFSIGQTIANVPKSAIGLAKATVEPLISPIQTTKALYGLASGLVQRIVPGEQGNEKYVNAVGDMLLERYGSIDNLKKTVQNDPVGTVADISTLLTGIGGLGKGSSIATKIGEVGSKIEPVTAGLKLTGKIAEQLGEKIGKPFAKAVKPEVMTTAAMYGIDVPASTVSKSTAVNILESGSLKGIFSKNMIDKVSNAETKINQLADDLVKSTGGITDPYIIGNKIIDNFSDFRKNWFQLKDELYNKAIIERGITADISKETQNYLKDILTNKYEAKKILGNVSDINYFENIYNNLTTSGIDAKDIQSTIKELNKKIGNPLDPITTGNKAELKKIATLLSQDLDNTLIKSRPELKQAIDEANTVYKTGLDTMNSTWGKVINKFKDNPEKVSKIITNKDLSAEQLPEIMKVLGEDMKPDIQSLVLNDIFSKARNKSRVGEPLSPGTLTKEIDKFGVTKLQMILDPNQYNKLKDIEMLVKNFNEGQKLAGGSQTGFINKLMGTLAVLTVSPLTAAKILIGDAAYSKFISSPAGQKWLTTGYELGKPGTALKEIAPKLTPYLQTGYQTNRLSEAIKSRLNK